MEIDHYIAHNGKTVGEYLLHETEVGEIVVFCDEGWQYGLVQIDDEDLFIGSLSSDLLAATDFTVAKGWFSPAPDVKMEAKVINVRGV